MNVPVALAESTGKRISVPIRSAHGVKTSVSIPANTYAPYVAHCGSVKEFRKCLNRAIRETGPRSGYSRSVLVRPYLNKHIKTAVAQS